LQLIDYVNTIHRFILEVHGTTSYTCGGHHQAFRNSYYKYKLETFHVLMEAYIRYRILQASK